MTFLFIEAKIAKEEAEKKHDVDLVKLLEACREQNLKLNKKKVRHKGQEIKFIGHIISDKKKIEKKLKVKSSRSWKLIDNLVNKTEQKNEKKNI